MKRAVIGRLQSDGSVKVIANATLSDLLGAYADVLNRKAAGERKVTSPSPAAHVEAGEATT